MRLSLAFSGIALTALSLPLPVYAGSYLSDEAWVNDAAGRAAASTLDDPWRDLVLLGDPTAVFEQPDNLADERILPTPPLAGVLEFPATALTVNYSVRTMDGPLYGTPDIGAGAFYYIDHAASPSGFSPFPDELLGNGVAGTDYTSFGGRNSILTSRSAILFEFSDPVSAFGLFLGDVESRPAGTLAEVRLFDDQDSMLNAGTSDLVPTGTVISSSGISTYDVFDNSNTSDIVGQWGNGTTQFYGFYNESPVSKMLLIVGDEDFGDQGLKEWIVFWGATSVESPSEGDFDRDLDVDAIDFLTWQRDPNIGLLSEWEADYCRSDNCDWSVPESGSLILAFTTLLFGLGRCWGRKLMF